MSELNARGQRIAGALVHVPEQWREAAIDWLRRERIEREEEIHALFGDSQLGPLWSEVDQAATASPRALRVAYQQIIAALLDPPQVPDETRSALRNRRLAMASDLRRVAQKLALDPAKNLSLAEFLEPSGWTPLAEDFPASEASATHASAVPALHALADALERDEPLTSLDTIILHDKPRRDANARQRTLESTLCKWLRRATGWPFDHLIAAGVSFALGVSTSAVDVSDRRTARESRRG